MIDFSSWQSVLSALAGIALFALVGIGIRLMVMMRYQQRRERQNRQINERLKVLIAAYKVLGGSFTGDLSVSPLHLRDLRQLAAADRDAGEGGGGEAASGVPAELPSADRRRRIRDAVEAALSDILLLGTEDQVRLAERAAREMVEGREVHMDALVVSLRDFIRAALDLDPIPANLAIPRQGPSRPSTGGGKGESGRGGGRGGGGGGGGMMGGGMGGGGMGGAGGGMGGGGPARGRDDPDPLDPA